MIILAKFAYYVSLIAAGLFCLLVMFGAAVRMLEQVFQRILIFYLSEIKKSYEEIGKIAAAKEKVRRDLSKMGNVN